MEISEVRVFPVEEEKLKAYASIVLDACFIVNDLKIIQGKKGLFISMPSRRRKRGGYRDVAHPLNNETRNLIETRVLAEYEKVTGQTVVREHDENELEEAVAAPVNGSAPLAPAAELGGESPTLEEVEKQHLRDSFWSVS